MPGLRESATKQTLPGLLLTWISYRSLSIAAMTGKQLFTMGHKANKNIPIGTQHGEAGSNVEAENIPLSMTGATGAPAPNGSAVSQIQMSDSTYTHKETMTLSDLFGHGPVGPPSSLPPREWTLEQLKGKIEDVLGLDCSGVVKIAFTDQSDGKFNVETCYFDDGQCAELWSVQTYRLHFSCSPLKFNSNMLGDVLANYEYNGICGVDMYLYGQYPELFLVDEEPEGSHSLAANSPTGRIHSDSNKETGDQNVQ